MRDRAATYDKPDGERSMGRAVEAFNAITGRDLTEPEGWLLLQVLKDVRLFQRPGYHADSAEDCIAYAALKAEAKAADHEREKFDPVIWNVWDGKYSSPLLDPSAKVEVQFGNGDTDQGPAGAFVWHTHDLIDGGIVRWRFTE